MTSEPLHYAPADVDGPPRRAGWRVWTVVALLGFAVLALPVVSVRRETFWMDAVTGSEVRQTTWFGASSPRRFAASPLEGRLRQMGVAWTPDWRYLNTTHYGLAGGATCHECGSAPPVYMLHTVLPAFAARASDAEVRALVSVLQTGTEAEQRAAVDAACDVALGTRAGP